MPEVLSQFGSVFGTPFQDSIQFLASVPYLMVLGRVSRLYQLRVGGLDYHSTLDCHRETKPMFEMSHFRASCERLP